MSSLKLTRPSGGPKASLYSFRHLRLTFATVLAMAALIALSIVSSLQTVSAAPTAAPNPIPAIPVPVTISGNTSRWCCRERGKCITTQCPQRVVRGVRFFGTNYRTQNSCISARCSNACVMTTRDKCQFYFMA